MTRPLVSEIAEELLKLDTTASYIKNFHFSPLAHACIQCALHRVEVQVQSSILWVCVDGHIQSSGY